MLLRHLLAALRLLLDASQLAQPIERRRQLPPEPATTPAMTAAHSPAR